MSVAVKMNQSVEESFQIAAICVLLSQISTVHMEEEPQKRNFMEISAFIRICEE